MRATMNEEPLLGPYLVTVGIGLVEGLIFLVLFDDATEFRRTLLLTFGAVWLAVGTDNFRDFGRRDVTKWGAVSFAGSLITFVALVVTVAKETAVSVSSSGDGAVWLWTGVIAAGFSWLFGLGGRAVIRKKLR